MFILAAGSYFDIREHRIPNWLVLAGIAAGLFLSWLDAGGNGGGEAVLQEMIFFACRFLVVTAAFFFLFICRMIGAGDIKIISLICGYLGFGTGFAAVAWGFLIGAFWSLVLMIVKGCAFQRFSYFLTYIRSIFQTKKITAYYSSSLNGYDAVIPLGLCMFSGVVLAVVFF
ncbi:prepilin peptidase [Lacrimispora sp. 38-1]|uniref:prepilin peptidase n=1 Tax=Lacrimispora sp. 38-1 TaxID=3125778 RepID=UPI003CE94D3A